MSFEPRSKNKPGKNSKPFEALENRMRLRKLKKPEASNYVTQVHIQAIRQFCDPNMGIYDQKAYWQNVQRFLRNDANSIDPPDFLLNTIDLQRGSLLPAPEHGRFFKDLPEEFSVWPSVHNADEALRYYRLSYLSNELRMLALLDGEVVPNVFSYSGNRVTCFYDPRQHSKFLDSIVELKLINLPSSPWRQMPYTKGYSVTLQGNLKVVQFHNHGLKNFNIGIESLLDFIRQRTREELSHLY